MTTERLDWLRKSSGTTMKPQTYTNGGTRRAEYLSRKARAEDMIVVLGMMLRWGGSSRTEH